MADWSQLPQEILCLIAKRLETRFDVLRFRSVCPSWRSSVPPKVYPLPRYLPSKTIDMCACYLHRLTMNTCYLVRLPPGANQTAPPACWLVNIREGTEERLKMQLLKPLSGIYELNPLPVNFPKVFDLTNFQVIELGHQFVAQYTVDIDHRLEHKFRKYVEKVAFLWSSTISDGFMMLARFGYFTSKLGLLRSGEKEWTLLEDVQSVGDIISFKGKFYAIELKGRTIVVDQYLKLGFLDHEFVGFPARKFLVQSGDNLLAVEMCYPTNSDPDAAGFRIFRLDEEELKWVGMESLGNQILFLGSCQAIAAAASEFYWGKGNLIFYSAECIFRGNSQAGLVYVFDLETAASTCLENCPAYSNLFWPPPEWVTCSGSMISPREVGGESRERESSAGRIVESPSSSSSSKRSFKFCCF